MASGAAAAREDFTIGLGTVGSGLWVSYNGGGKWRHIQGPMDNEGNVRACAVSPHDPRTIACTVDFDGVYISRDGGGSWASTGATIDLPLWSVTFDPHGSDRMFVGARPGVYRSGDAGASFERLDTTLPTECLIGVPRTTNVVIDPADAARVWATVEIGGLHRSDDGGDSWVAHDPLGPSEFHNDMHGFAVRGRDADTELLATTPFGLARSHDDGLSWNWHEFEPFQGAKFEFAYSRCIHAPWDDGTIIVCVGDGIPGSQGALEISRDGGASWKRADLPSAPNSTMYWLATHPDLPGVIVATSLFGQIYLSTDHAETWQVLGRELGQIRGSFVIPNS